MSDAIVTESPLARFARMDDSSTPHGDLLSVYERPLLGYLNLRGDVSDPGFTKAVAGVLGMPPSSVSTFTEAQGATICWLGPDEWLVVMARERAAGAIRALQHAFAASFASVTDVSGGHTLIALRGSRARDVLEKGCPLDFEPRAFGANRCAQSHIAKAPVLIRVADDVPTYEIVVRRSLAEYLWTWLCDAAAAFSTAVADVSHVALRRGIGRAERASTSSTCSRSACAAP